jgi:hypothetical protein
MNRSIRAALVLSAVALAVPATALAGRQAAHIDAARGNAVTLPLSAMVTGYSGGTLTLTLPSNATIVGAVDQRTRFICPRVPNGSRHGTPPPCDATQLVSGEGVASAVVTLGPAGMAFRQLVLVAPTAPPSGSAV